MLLSIIVPVYNGELYIKKCLDSLINQSWKDIEIIVVDDCSNDNTSSILKEYSEKIEFLSFYSLPINLKQGGARNIGIKNSKGSYIAFVDSDDYIEEDMFKKMMETAIKNNSDLVTCNANKICDSEIKTYLNGKMMSYFSGKSIKLLNVEEFQKFAIIPMPVWTMVIKKNIVLENNIFFPENLKYEDNFFSRLLKYYVDKYNFIDENLYYYVEHSNSVTNKKNDFGHYNRIAVQKLYLEDMKQRNLYPKYKNSVDFDMITLFYANTINDLLLKYDSIDKNTLNELKIYMKNNRIFWEKNSLFTQFGTKKQKILIILNEYFQWLLPLFKIIIKKRRTSNAK